MSDCRFSSPKPKQSRKIARTPSSTDLLKQFDDAVEISARQGDLFAALVIALTEFAHENKFDAMTLKCWGDIVEAYGIAGCGVVSILNDRGIYTGCEGDIMGTITTLIARRMTGIHPFLTDFVAVDRDANTGLMWHGGCGPVGLADPKQKKHLFSHFAAGKGVTAGGLRVADLGLSWTTDYGLDADAAGNAILAFRDDRSGADQITATKIAPAGVPLWGSAGVQVSSGDQGNYPPGVVVTSDGNVAVGWSGYDRMGPAAFVTMLDANGAEIWSVSIPSKGDLTYDSATSPRGRTGR